MNRKLRNKVRKLKHLPRCRKTGKAMYSTEGGALAGMRYIWSHDPKTSLDDLHVYVCPDCKHYHVGHRSYYAQAIKNQQAKNDPLPAA